MSSPSAYQCLFCNHLNPAGASFCNECGSQLQLQQCDLCGSINKRSARVCYKCGAAFTFASPISANAAVLEHRDPERIDPSMFAQVQTSLPESLVEALSARHASPRDGFRKTHAVAAPAAEAVEAVETVETADDRPAAASPAAPPKPAAAAAAAADGFNYRHVAALVSLVSLLAMASLFLMRPPAGPGLNAGSGASAVTGGDQVPGRAVSPEPVGRPAAPADAGVASEGGATVAARNEDEVAAAASVVSREPATRACQPAVAALGLCDAAPAQEKR